MEEFVHKGTSRLHLLLLGFVEGFRFLGQRHVFFCVLRYFFRARCARFTVPEIELLTFSCR